MTIIADPRVPDGSRPLEVGRPVPFLEPAVADVDLSCFIAVHCRHYGLTVHEDCHETISAGQHYLSHLSHDEAGNPTGQVWNYCAPCAVRECAHWQVREATP